MNVHVGVRCGTLFRATKIPPRVTDTLNQRRLTGGAGLEEKHFCPAKVARRSRYSDDGHCRASCRAALSTDLGSCHFGWTLASRDVQLAGVGGNATLW
jgi:hypothetical protein